MTLLLFISTSEYSTARGFSIPPIPVGQTVLSTAIPLKGSTQTLPVTLWNAHCDPPAIPNGWWVESQWAIKLILSTQTKQGKVHRSDSPHCNPTQSSSETLPVFSLQCFHWNGWTPSGGKNLNPFFSVLLPTRMGGKLKPPSGCTVW